MVGTRRLNVSCLSLLLIFCLALGSFSDPQSQTTTNQHPKVRDGSISIHDDITAGNLKNDIYAEEMSVHGQYREILVIKIHNHLFRVPDERVSFTENGHRYFFNDDEDSYGHDFELSPDKRWLFVVRKCMHTVGVGYLYHRTNNRGFIPELPYGLRFDAAAIKFFARTYGTPQPLLSEGARIIGFENWDRDGSGMTLTLTVGETHPRMRKGVEIEGHYDFRKHKFRLVYKENFFDTADR